MCESGLGAIIAQSLHQPVAAGYRLSVRTLDVVRLLAHGAATGKAVYEHLRGRHVTFATPVFHAQVFFGFLGVVALAVSNEGAMAASEGTQQVLDFRRRISGIGGHDDGDEQYAEGD